MTEYSWIMYRRNSSAGHGRWEYMEVATEDLRRLARSDFIENYLESGNDGYSEHYRGYEFKEIPRPPPEVLESRIRSAKGQIKSATEDLARFEQQLAEGLRNG
ncbi:MAG: hypothetical protein LLG14_11655 [Nocardiaceae bacterium]|nr:hypothetical protein [Nocardiaceae bacterium]